MDENDILILTLIGSVTSIIMLCLKLSYKSKCTDVNCCFGILKFKRNVNIETNLEEKNTKSEDNVIPKVIPQIPRPNNLDNLNKNVVPSVGGGVGSSVEKFPSELDV